MRFSEAQIELERLRGEHEDAEQQDDATRRLNVVQDAALLAQSHALPIPDWASFRVELLRRYHGDYLRERFERTGNPMYAVQAYVGARFIGDPPPAWALKFVDLALMHFWLSYLEFDHGLRPNEPDEALCKAFKIKTGGKTGQGTVWSLAKGSKNNARWRSLGVSVALILVNWTRDGRPTPMDSVFEEVIRRSLKPVSRSTVRRAWERYQREYPDAIAEINGRFHGCTCCLTHSPTRAPQLSNGNGADPFRSITQSLEFRALYSRGTSMKSRTS
jgi:hypothetical protein